MPATMELSWEFEPKTLFEEPFTLDIAGCPVSLRDGVVIATLPLVGGDTRSTLRLEVEEKVHSLFLAGQLAAHEIARISGPRLTTIGDDGTRGYVIEAQAGIYHFRGTHADLVYTRSDGTVVDTRRDRVNRQQRLGRAAVLHAQDPALGRMLRSYGSAISDLRDELIHLYEVRDTLSSAFGDEAAATSQLRLSRARWKRLGQICNSLPLHEGRHRGHLGAPLRNATTDELSEARAIASEFIESYVRFLERVDLEMREVR